MFNKDKGFKSSDYKPSYFPTERLRQQLSIINYQLLKKLSPLLLLSLCVGCGNSQADSKQSQVLLTPRSRSALPRRSNLNAVMQAQTVEIHNDWNGYSDITPILRHYKLRLVNKDLVGNTHIAVGGYGAGGIHQQRTTKVRVPAVVVTKFLTTLAETPLQAGIYKPLITRKDDYPSIEIQLKIDKKQVIFSSKSQGVDRIPWKIAIVENNTAKEYISNSPIPAQAFRLLNSSLDRSGVDGIIQQRRQRKRK
jgi:hypothetical protein